jgi:hypothetical protein
MSMDSKNVVIQTNAPPPKFLSKQEPEIDIWEPPFERWMKLADDLLSGWMCEAPFGELRRLKAGLSYGPSKSS